MTSLECKVALVTGAKGGLGTAVSQAFLEAGAAVAGVSRSIRDSDYAHSRFIAFPGDLSSSEAARRVVESVLARMGHIDTLVHLVGAFAGGKSISETGDTVLDQMLDVNLKSTFYIAKAVLPHMRIRKTGRIIAIGSRAAVEASPKAAAYSASKAATVALIRALAAEDAEAGISANILLPGTMDTPANRAAMPKADFTTWVRTEQVARLIVALASDDLSQVNGAAIPIYGRDI
jgi:NAD(P)-dependent dehydrogenase (short-subunit alcohol dehydrogenase family)